MKIYKSICRSLRTLFVTEFSGGTSSLILNRFVLPPEARARPRPTRTKIRPASGGTSNNEGKDSYWHKNVEKLIRLLIWIAITSSIVARHVRATIRVRITWVSVAADFRISAFIVATTLIFLTIAVVITVLVQTVWREITFILATDLIFLAWTALVRATGTTVHSHKGGSNRNKQKQLNCRKCSHKS